MAVVLLAAAGLLIHGVYRLQHADRGFSPDNVTVMQVRGAIPQTTKPIPSIVFQHYVDHLGAMPGIEAAAAATPLPMRNPPGANFSIEGRPADLASVERQPATFQIVSPDYFKALRIPLREGRLISNDDLPDRPRVTVVSDTMARRYWPGESPLGRVIRVGAATMTIVGVVGDVQATPLDTKPVCADLRGQSPAVRTEHEHPGSYVAGIGGDRGGDQEGHLVGVTRAAGVQHPAALQS